VERPQDKFPKEQHVALAAHGKVGDGGPVDRAAQHSFEQLGDGPSVETHKLEAVDDAVLPEGGHRFRCHFSGAERGQHKGRVRPGKLLDQRG
jgi:hypothetical protein